jgi:hypothetical protein
VAKTKTQDKAAFAALLRMWRGSQHWQGGKVCNSPGQHRRHNCHRMKQEEAAGYFTRRCNLDPPMSSRQYRRYENAETGCSWHTYNSMVAAMSAGQSGQTGQEE